MDLWPDSAELLFSLSLAVICRSLVYVAVDKMSDRKQFLLLLACNSRAIRVLCHGLVLLVSEMTLLQKTWKKLYFFQRENRYYPLNTTIDQCSCNTCCTFPLQDSCLTQGPGLNFLGSRLQKQLLLLEFVICIPLHRNKGQGFQKEIKAALSLSILLKEKDGTENMHRQCWPQGLNSKFNFILLISPTFYMQSKI